MSTHTHAAPTRNGEILNRLDQLFGGGTAAGLSDAQLLRRFAAERDEGAFAALLERHGPMVLGVCRRRLGFDQAAVDDAFQATFLILVRKAADLRQADRLAPWLFGVALRVSGRARQESSRRRSIEGEPLRPDIAVITSEIGQHLDHADTRRLLDEELGRLPTRFRDVLVMCYLEGLTHEQASERLGCPVGTVRSRLFSAREALRHRLVRRGLGGSAAALAALFDLSGSPLQAAVPPALASATVRLAIPVLSRHALAGVVPAAVSALVEGATHTMSWTKVSLGVGLIAVLGTGGGLALSSSRGSGSGGAGTSGSPAATIAQDPNSSGGNRPEQTPTDPSQVHAPQESLLDTLIGNLTGQRQRAERQRALAERERAVAAERLAQVVAEELQVQEASLRAELEKARARELDLTRQLEDLKKVRESRRVPNAGENPFNAPAPGDPNAANDPFRQPPADPNNPFGGMPARGGMPGSGGMPGGGLPPGPSKFQTIRDGNLIVLQPKNEHRVIAHSNTTGNWAAYDLPEGIRSVPILAGGTVAALTLAGEKITELAVFLSTDGKWHRQALAPPALGNATPIASGNLVAYAIGNRVYAFSAVAGRWDVVTLSQNVVPILDGSHVIVEDNGTLAVFSAQTGTWSTIEPDAEGK